MFTYQLDALLVPDVISVHQELKRARGYFSVRAGCQAFGVMAAAFSPRAWILCRTCGVLLSVATRNSDSAGK
ncbi:MAG: hypothetical protein KKD01_17225 [Proteobacteria bacterium]|nr:hypothetical protein [Pseudomonadota bacterium]MBU1456468.1 hypothetical protein [Pseudomonadota bacterium]